jgi:hypothetical protein
MKKYLMLCSFLLPVILVNVGIAQEPPKDEQKIPSVNNRFYAGGQASTNGLGLNLRYVISKRLSINAGLESVNLITDFEVQGYGVPFVTELHYKSGGLFLLGELFYTRSLYLTAGLMSNTFQPRAEGKALTSIRYGDIVLPPSVIGTLSVEVEPEFRYSPYAGLGIRRYFDKNQIVSCSLETGFFYLGNPDVHLEATGLLKPTADPEYGKEEYLEAQFSAYKYYPVVKVGVAARIF